MLVVMTDVCSHRPDQRFDMGALLCASLVLVRSLPALVVRLWHRVRAELQKNTLVMCHCCTSINGNVNWQMQS